MIKQKISKEIWEMKYQYEGETEEQFYKRVPVTLFNSSSDEEIKLFCDIMKVKDKNELIELAYKLMSNHNCMLAGRPMYAIGTNRKDQTYSNCFLEGHEVVSENAIEKIENVKVGTKVLTHTNQFNTVNSPLQKDYSGKVVEITSKFFDNITSTESHEFLTLDGWVEAKDLGTTLNKKYIKVATREVPFNTNEIVFDITNTMKLNEGCVFSFDEDKVSIIQHFIGGNGANGKKESSKVQKQITLNADMQYLFGRWLGDGSITKKGNYRSVFQIVFNAKNERDSFERCVNIVKNNVSENVQLRENVKQNTLIMRLENPIFGEFVYNFMTNEGNKILPNELMGSFDTLMGILDSDGCLLKNGNIKLSLKDKNLLNQIRKSFIINGVLPTKIKKVDSVYKSHLNDNVYSNYMFTISPVFVNRYIIDRLNKHYDDGRVQKIKNYKLNNSVIYFKEKEGELYVKIDDINVYDYSGKVYNLSVEIDNSYNVNGVICHNCYVLPIKNDSMTSIMDTIKEAALTMKSGGGNGYSFSILRPKNSKISTSGGQSTGPISFMKIFDSVCDSIKGGNNRRGAQIGVLDVWHPDIEEFIEVKQKKGILINFNISVGISDDFMKAVNNDNDWSLIFPDTTFEKYNDEWDGDIVSWKDKNYPIEVYKTVKAKDLYDKIMKATYKYSEPGVLFLDTINKENNLWYEEHIFSTNPCGEEPLPAYSSCNLGSINFSTMVNNPFENCTFDYELMEKSIKLMIIMLNKVIDLNYYPLDKQKQVALKKRPIGLGFTGLADCLCMMKLKYSDKKGKQFSEMLFELLRNLSYETSSRLAKGLKKTFEGFDIRFLESDFCKRLPDYLRTEIKQNGIYNSRLLTVAPTGTTSLIMNNCSSGIEPIFCTKYYRKVKLDNDEEVQQSVTDYAVWLYENLYGEDTTLPDYFETVDNLTAKDHLDIQIIAQKYIDASVSKTINLPEDYSFEDFKNIYINAWANKLKGTTTYIPNEIRGSVLSTDVKQEQCDFFDVWLEHEKGEVIKDSVSLPAEYPMRGFKITSEGRKWYVHVAFKDKNKTSPFAIFVNTNHTEKQIDAYNAVFALEELAKREGILLELIDENNKKSSNQSNVVKISRAIGLLLRHNVKIEKIVNCLDDLDIPINSLIYRLKVFLSNYMVDKKTGVLCPECQTELTMIEGCKTCPACFWSKCGK